MRTEFNKLVEVMMKYDLYNSTDEVGIALTDLFNKITEVENRIKYSIMRTEFNKLVEVLKDENIYQSYDEVRVALTDLFNKITEVENRIKCVIDTNNDSRQILKAFAYGIVDKGLDEVPIYSDQFEILQRSCNDIDIAINMNDTECIENDWYGLFGVKEREDKFKPRSVAEYVATLPNEEPPTSLCKTPQTHEFVKDIIAKLKVIDVDGETMQYILEQVGMDEQMHRQLVMKNDFGVTKDLMREQFELSL